ncbi:MAG: GNAT family N-acetyltransferase [Candidatus Microbacterium colombiense]|nr:MAG: GNAT family N-acetyltransferase [Microbacterium sp.]
MDDITLRLWDAGDLALLHRANTVEMTTHLNGPESDTEVADRHARYLRCLTSGEAQMFVILRGGHAVGSIGFWKTTWKQEPAFETGWFVLPEAQGHGIAGRALAALLEEIHRHQDARHWLVAFPETANPASNAICRRAGFALVGSSTETFRSADLTINEWVLDLRAPVSS